MKEVPDRNELDDSPDSVGKTSIQLMDLQVAALDRNKRSPILAVHFKLSSGILPTDSIYPPDDFALVARLERAKSSPPTQHHLFCQLAF